MPRIELFIPGRPRPKARPRRGKHGGFYTPRATKTWELIVAWTWKINTDESFTGPIEVWLTFHLPDKRKRDIDNLAKAVLDGLSGVAYKDDNQIERLTVLKKLDPTEPGVWIYVQPIDDAPAVLGPEEG